MTTMSVGASAGTAGYDRWSCWCWFPILCVISFTLPFIVKTVYQFTLLPWWKVIGVLPPSAKSDMYTLSLMQTTPMSPITTTSIMSDTAQTKITGPKKALAVTISSYEQVCSFNSSESSKHVRDNSRLIRRTREDDMKFNLDNNDEYKSRFRKILNETTMSERRLTRHKARESKRVVRQQQLKQCRTQKTVRQRLCWFCCRCHLRSSYVPC